MKKRKHRTSVGRNPISRPSEAETHRPTPETLSKLRHDVIDRLYREGRLREEHVRAAAEIRRVWEAIGRALFPSSSTVDTPRQPHLRRSIHDPAQRLSDVNEVIWRKRYRPWADEMSIPIVAGAIRVSRLQLVLDVAVDNYGIRQVEAWYRMRHGTGLEHLRAALHRYAVLSEWIDETDG